MRIMEICIWTLKDVTRNTVRYPFLLHLKPAHTKTGKFVRYRPNAIVVNSPEGYQGNSFRSLSWTRTLSDTFRHLRHREESQKSKVVQGARHHKSHRNSRQERLRKAEEDNATRILRLCKSRAWAYHDPNNWYVHREDLREWDTRESNWWVV